MGFDEREMGSRDGKSAGFECRKTVFDTNLAPAYLEPSRHISSVTTSQRTND